MPEAQLGKAFEASGLLSLLQLSCRVVDTVVKTGNQSEPTACIRPLMHMYMYDHVCTHMCLHAVFDEHVCICTFASAGCTHMFARCII